MNRMARVRGVAFARRPAGRVKRAVVRRDPGAPVRTAPQQPPEDPFLRLAVDPTLWLDPFPMYEQMRARGPVYSPTPSHVVCTGYDEAVAAMKEPSFFVEPSEDDPVGAGLTQDSIVKSNPPRHPELRRYMAKWFSPRTIEELDVVVTKFCDDLLDPVMARREFDLVQEYALPLAVKVIAYILGVPDTYHARFQELGDAAARMLDPFLTPEQTQAGRTASAEMLDYFRELYDTRRRDPGDDLLSALLVA